MRKDVGRSNVFYIHVTLLPALSATGELKTKPTQHTVKELRGIGIQPDVIIAARTSQSTTTCARRSPSSPTSPVEAVIPAATAETIYEVPLQFNEHGLDDLIVRELGLADTAKRGRPDAWRALVELHQEAQAGDRDRAGGQVHRAARRLHVRDRGAAPRRLGQRP